jgi:hypothetical protein
MLTDQQSTTGTGNRFSSGYSKKPKLSALSYAGGRPYGLNHACHPHLHQFQLSVVKEQAPLFQGRAA